MKLGALKICFAVFAWLLATGGVVLAAPVATVEPSVIDEKGLARDIFEREIMVKNTSVNRIALYAVVSDINQSDGVLPSQESGYADRTKSLTSWVEFTRGEIVLLPGESKKIPLKIKVSPDVKPGDFHAQIALAPGNNRPQAEGAAQAGDVPKLFINISIKEHIVEKLESNLFKNQRNINYNGSVDFVTSLVNIGNRELQPGGEITIFNRNGAEVNALPINPEGKVISPNSANTFASAWKTKNELGKYRARLNVKYGNTSAESFQDTIYFWVIPSWILLIIGSIIGLLVLLILYFFFKLLKSNKVVVEEEVMPERSHIIDLKNRN